MPFKKGQSGNPAGKPKGAKDTVPRSFRAIARKVLQNHGEGIEAALLRGIADEAQSHRYLTILANLEKQQIEVSGAITLAGLLLGKSPASSTVAG